MAIRSWSTSARIFKTFRRLILPPSFVRLVRFPRLSWLAVSPFSQVRLPRWHCRRLRRLLRISRWLFPGHSLCPRLRRRLSMGLRRPSCPALSFPTSPCLAGGIPLRPGYYRLPLRLLGLRWVVPTSLSHFGFLRHEVPGRFGVLPPSVRILMVWMVPLDLLGGASLLAMLRLPLIFMGGNSSIMGGPLASRLRTTPGAVPHFLGGFLRRFLPTFMVLLGLSHFMGGRLLRLHRWRLHSFRRFRRCVLCLRRTFWAPQPRM